MIKAKLHKLVVFDKFFILPQVNKGQRSSSLHYAACFGRPQIAKVLLRFGANPDLRDEDGKTPLDKARERNDEGHREVASILQSPAGKVSNCKLTSRS